MHIPKVDFNEEVSSFQVDNFCDRKQAEAKLKNAVAYEKVVLIRIFDLFFNFFTFLRVCLFEFQT